MIQKTIQISQLQCIDKVVDDPVVQVVYVPQLQVVKETVEISQLLFVEKIVVIPDDPLSLVKSLITDMINRVQSEGTGASADKDQFARVEAVITDLISHVMRGTVQAEARQPHRGSKQQPAKQAAQERERKVRKKERKEERGEETRKEKGGQVEEEEEKEVVKNVTGWTLVTTSAKQMRRMVQIFVKVDGMKTVAMELLPEDEVQKSLNTVSGSDWDLYLMCEERILRKSDKLKSCGVRDGSAVQVTSRMRGGGTHKDKKGVKRRRSGVQVQ